jgi:hypothetical protein
MSFGRNRGNIRGASLADGPNPGTLDPASDPSGLVARPRQCCTMSWPRWFGVAITGKVLEDEAMGDNDTDNLAYE